MTSSLVKVLYQIITTATIPLTQSTNSQDNNILKDLLKSQLLYKFKLMI